MCRKENTGYKVGIVLERLRKELNISWTELSEKTGVSRCYLFKLRKGIDGRSNKPLNPTIAVLVNISDALEISRKEFLQQCGYIEK